ncbi:MAG: hypothetical protein CMB80_03875 [Flammeovirgaceae bacterium]|nr:hypothetical protein [Flammeovirgaceae bacterium]MBR06105.1 hypothetical protein [Rickettsiales bacterium]HCX22174.1 hypothetical protein [Cytophagales bacterium]
MAFQTKAHNPAIASFNIRQLEHVWIIEGSFAQSGLHAAVEKVHPGIVAENSNSYKQAIAEYVKSHIEITRADGSNWALGEGGVRLGSHQTDVKFVLAKTSEFPEELTVSISCLAENKHQQNLLRIPAFKSVDHVVLSDENEFTSTIRNKASLQANVAEVDGETNNLYYIIGLVLLMLALTSLKRNRLVRLALFMRGK